MPATLAAPTYLATADLPDELRRVEIVSAGMNWPASTGDVTVTLAHIADAIRAANDDPHIQVPRVRLGHISSLNGGPRYDPFAAISDAEPAFGRFPILWAENDGATLCGAMDAVPDWLAEGAHSMFPSRSMECIWDVTTEGGKRYSMVVTAVSLLGAYLPACRDLEDLQRLTAGGPAAMSAAREETPSMPALSVSENEVRQRFNFEWATDPESIFEDADGNTVDTYWWWAREIRIGPEEVIADDDAGHLYRVPFSVTDRDEVVFGDPQRVRVQYVAASGAPTDQQTERAVHVEANASVRQQAVACFARRGQSVAASFTDRPTKPTPTAASTRPEREESTMPGITPEQLARLRELPEDADQSAIDAALTGDEPAAETEPDSEPVETPAAQPEPVAAAVATERGVTVDRDALAQLQADAAAGRQARDEQLRADRETYLTAAIGRGKFPPAARAAYASQLAQGGEVEAATRRFIDALPDNTVPLDPIGSGADLSSASATGDDLVGEDGLLDPSVSLLTASQRARAGRR